MPDLSKLHALFACQHGLATRQQLLEAGVAPRTIDTWLRRTWIVRVRNGVYRHGASPCTEHTELVAAVLASGPGAVASHRRALELWDVRLRLAAPLEVAVVREAGPHPIGVVVHRSRDLHPDHVTTRHGVPVTTPARSLVDAGQVLKWWEVEGALESMLRSGHVNLDQVRAALVLHARRGRPGIGALRRVLRERALDERPADSALEAAFARLCRDAGLPTPELHPAIVIDGIELHPDFRFVGTTVLVELDGWAHHGDRQAFERDRQRDQLLVGAGHRVLRFTWRQVVHQPWQVVAALRRALDSST